MKFLNAYIEGASTAIRSKKVASWIYIIYLLVAMALTIPFMGLVKAIICNSMLPEKLMEGFNATVLYEMMVSGGQSLLFYVKAWWPILIIFILIQVYINGGLLYWVANPRGKFRIKLFHQSAIEMFGRFTKVTVYMMVLHLIVALLVYLPAILILGGRELTSDKLTVLVIFYSCIIHSILLIILNLMGDVTKVAIYHGSRKKVLRHLWKSVKWVISRFSSAFVLAILLLIIPLGLILLFYFLRKDLVVDTTGLILLVFIVQQVVIWLKCLLRIWRFRSIYRYYTLFITR